MRFLFTAQPAYSHVRALYPVARPLQRAGHHVAFASSASMEAGVAEDGFDFFSVGPRWELNASAGALFEGCPPPGPERKVFSFCEVFAKRTVLQTFSDYSSLIAAFRPDVVVHEADEYGGLLAAESLGVPHASVATSGESSTTWLAKLVEPSIAEVGIKLGFPSAIGAHTIHRYLHLCALPPEFDGPLSLFSDTSQFVRLHELELGRSTSAQPPSSPSARPLVLAALGTSFHLRPGVFEAIFAGLAGEPLDVVMGVGRERDPAELGSAENIRVERFVAQSELLKSCGAFINHAGFNSVKESIAAGVPMLMIPLAADHPYIAERCSALGLGIRLPVDALTPDAIRKHTTELLSDPDYRKNVATLQRSLARLPGQDRVVELLVELGANRRPLRRKNDVEVVRNDEVDGPHA